jgi:hypothetical protein
LQCAEPTGRNLETAEKDEDDDDEERKAQAS